MAKNKKAPARRSSASMGWWAFVIGLVVVVITSFSTVNWTWLLVILGLVVGYLNVSDKEAVTFLIATIALMTAGSAGLGLLWGSLESLLANLVVFVAPAAVVVALKAVYEAAQ